MSIDDIVRAVEETRKLSAESKSKETRDGAGIKLMVDILTTDPDFDEVKEIKVWKPELLS